MALCCAAALAMIAPFFWLGNASGHDVQFHASSWLDVAEQWKQGVWFPRWAEWANYGFGEPRYIFYPPLSWLLGAALGTLFSWKWVVALYVAVVQTLAGSSAYALLRRAVTHRGALFGAVCFAANPYALLIVYMRCDYAELLAMAFFPWLLLGALRLCGMLDASGRSSARDIGLCAGAYAAVWLSNAPAGVVASYSVALVFAWAALANRSWRAVINGGAGIALGLGLAAFYLAPAAYEQRWVNIAQVLSTGLHPSENFLYATTSDAEHDAFNRIASHVAVLLIVTAGLLAVSAMWRRAEGEQDDGRPAVTLLALAGVATLLMLRPTLFLWELLPKLKFVQFPWRWMSIVVLVLVWFLAAAVDRQKRWSAIWAIGLVAALCGTGVFLGKRTWWDWDDVSTVQAAIGERKGFEGTDEYDPLGDDHTNIPEKAPEAELLTRNGSHVQAARGQVEVKRWLPEERVVRVRAQEPMKLALRALKYPAWQVEVNGAAAIMTSREDYAQIIVAVPKGASEVRMLLVRTTDRMLGMALSVFSLLVAVALAWAGRQRAPAAV